MKIEVENYQEMLDGRATLTLDMDQEAINFFAKLGVTTALKDSLQELVDFHGLNIDDDSNQFQLELDL